MWMILMVFFYVFGTISRIERRKIAKKYPQNNAASLLLFYLMLVPFGYVFASFYSFDLSLMTPKMYLILFLGGAIFPVAGIMGYEANRRAEASLVALLGNLTPVITTTLAVVLLGEKLSIGEIAGIALLLMSGVLVAGKLHKSANSDIKLGIVFSILTAAIVGIGSTFEKSVISELELGTYMVFGWSFQLFWVSVISFYHRDRVVRFFTTKNSGLKDSSVWAMTSVVKASFFLGALSIANASVVVPAASFGTITIVLAAYYFLDERDHLAHKLFAAAIGIAGLLLINIF